MRVSRLVFVIPSLNPGGMERVMSELLNYIVKQLNRNVHLILYGIERSVFYELDSDIQVHRPRSQFNNRKRFWYTLRIFLFLRKKIRSLNPDAILSFGEVWNNFLLACWRLKPPLFIWGRAS